MQFHAVCHFRPGLPAALDATHYQGGNTWVDGAKGDHRLKYYRYGLTLALPVNVRNSINLWQCYYKFTTWYRIWYIRRRITVWLGWRDLNLGASLLDKLPLGGVFLGSMLLMLLASRIGGWIGGREFNRGDGESKVQSAAAVGAALGLLAFMLAITFSITNARFDERRHLVLKEANAIGTAYLRTDILKVAEKRRAQCLLTDYVANRLTFLNADNAQRFSLLRRQSEDMQDALWKIGISATERNPNPPNTLFLSALNELIDVHQERVSVGVQYRMPRVFWATLYSLVCITMLLAGYDERVSGARRSYIISLPIAAAFSLVLTLVVVLDRPQYWVNPLPFYDIQSTLARYPITCE